MTKTQKIILFISGFVLGSAGLVSAMPSFFDNSCATSTATSTLAFLTPGKATTTLTLDSAIPCGGARSLSQAFDSAVLLTQFTGSSTASTLGIQLQFSQDGINWFDDTYSVGFAATTTSPIGLGIATSYTLPMATSTTGLPPFGLTNGGPGFAARTLNFPTPTRFVRAVYYIPAALVGQGAGNANGGVYGTIVAKRQTSK